jgi:hypothetical protein
MAETRDWQRNSAMWIRVLESMSEVDADVRRWLKRAYVENG